MVMTIVPQLTTDNTLLLSLEGKLTYESRSSFLGAFSQPQYSEVRTIVINFAGVSFVDSVGLGLLLLVDKRLKDSKISLSFEVPEGPVMQLLRGVNIDKKVPISPVLANHTPNTDQKIATFSQTGQISPLAFESLEMQELLLPILETLKAKDCEIPPLNEVGQQVLAILADPEATANQLVILIQQDPALVGKIFKTASSAAFGTTRKIESLSQAITWLGLNTVAGLALALTFQSQVFNDRGYEREVRALWAHAIATAFYAKSLASLIGAPPDMAFLCGLLHSIGKLFIVHHINQTQNTDSHRLSWAAMQVLMNQSYIEIGGQLAESWNFPYPIKEAIDYHQHYSFHLATHPSKGAAITCLAKHLATNHLDSGLLSEEALRALPVTEALKIPQDVMEGIFDIKNVIQAQIDSLLL